MQLGLTIPLMRLLKTKDLPDGGMADRLFCWDLHAITLHGKSSLLGVHCKSRYTFVRYEMTPMDWSQLDRIAMDAIARSLTAAGLFADQAAAYLRMAGAAERTKTHGRREVAFLNRAWDDVVALDYTVDSTSQHQPLLGHAVNSIPCRCAGDSERLTATEHLQRCLSFRFAD